MQGAGFVYVLQCFKDGTRSLGYWKFGPICLKLNRRRTNRNFCLVSKLFSLVDWLVG